MTRILLVAALALPLIAARCGGESPTLPCEGGVYEVDIPPTGPIVWEASPEQAGQLDGIFPGSIQCLEVEEL